LTALVRPYLPVDVLVHGPAGAWPLVGPALIARATGSLEAILALVPLRREADADTLLRSLYEHVTTLLEAVTLANGERLQFSFLFLFLGALPCTEWLDDTIGRDDDGFILTGPAANADKLLETTVPGIFAAGDVRSGSTKRCATAVGEGALAVQLVHAQFAAD
jgi:thioredoxin reductase